MSFCVYLILFRNKLHYSAEQSLLALRTRIILDQTSKKRCGQCWLKNPLCFVCTTHITDYLRRRMFNVQTVGPMAFPESISLFRGLTVELYSDDRILGLKRHENIIPKRNPAIQHKLRRHRQNTSVHPLFIQVALIRSQPGQLRFLAGGTAAVFSRLIHPDKNDKLASAS